MIYRAPDSPVIQPAPVKRHVPTELLNPHKHMPEHMAADNRDSDDTISSVSGVARSTYGVLEMQLNGTLPPRPSRKYKVIIIQSNHNAIKKGRLHWRSPEWPGCPGPRGGARRSHSNYPLFITGMTAWFRSYLSDRTFRVVYGGDTSSTVCIICSVPQGSVLGPRLFIVYTSDLADVVIEHGVHMQAFADDSQLYLHCHRDRGSARTLHCRRWNGWMSANRAQRR